MLAASRCDFLQGCAQANGWTGGMKRWQFGLCFLYLLLGGLSGLGMGYA